MSKSIYLNLLISIPQNDAVQTPESIIGGYTLRVKKIDITEKTPCLLEPRKLQVSAQVGILLSEILPILFLALPHSNYSKAFGSVTFLLRGKLVSIYSSGKINLGCVVREEVAVAL